VNKPVGDAEAEVVDDTEITMVDIVEDELDEPEFVDVEATEEEVVETTVPFLMYKESLLPAPVISV
jgi:hypothetical protein